MEWIYGLNAEFVKEVKSLGVTVSGAVNTGTQVGFDLRQKAELKDVSILDLAGEPVHAPWMRAWETPGLWLCVNNPKVRAAYLDALKQMVDLGVQDIQRDDPAGNVAALNWGACFCKHCVDEFGRYLSDKPAEMKPVTGQLPGAAFNYREYLVAQGAPVGDAFANYDGGQLKKLFGQYQEQSTIEFHRWWREELNRYAGRTITISANVVALPNDKVAQEFDFWLGELPMRLATPEGLKSISRQARGRQILTMPLHTSAPVEPLSWIALTRRTLATAYAHGMLMEAPWDTYLPPPWADRHYGDPADFADLYAMVRASSVYLDGYEETPPEGTISSASPTAGAPTEVTVPDAQVYAVTRVKPGDRAAPVVVHLVDWADEPHSFRLNLPAHRIFSGRPFRAELIVPKTYDAAAHERAFTSGGYEPLVERLELPLAPDGGLVLPPLHPWGILVLSRSDLDKTAVPAGKSNLP
ncbi:hypothetical protein Verru16b_02986 [Lacunisphaera limnophila]|uniref:Uncharacterized protein n=1 Tax=Lacunisphaera limnophila TaxID=1838286 RepID=A0A1D8AYD8_9BACT|nr:hypothetical protein Verru16b_02986 [Lacunisphaera limnophila]